MEIKTASWFTKLPADHQKVGISRGTPRGHAPGYKKYMALAPGAWFNSVSPAEYLTRYNQILATLDPRVVVDELVALAPGKTPVLLCFEDPRGCNCGDVWCHRHVVAKWLEDRLGIVVEEVGFPLLDRWAKLRKCGVEPPNYR